MPFIGNQPALSYTSFAKQDFTTSATTSYTLDNPVANANELALFINFVRQEPTTAYSASGTSLTLTSATSSSDDMYCVFLGKAVQTVNPPNASVGLSQLTATGTKDATTFLRGDNTFASAGGTNTPAFAAYQSIDQTGISRNTATKVNFDTEHFDSDGKFDTTNKRFTPTVAGKYFIIGMANLTIPSYDPRLIAVYIYKNGSLLRRTQIYAQNSFFQNNQDNPLTVSTFDTANTTDYYEIYAKANQDVGGTVTFQNGTSNTFFGAYKIIE
jgi:hypothetical protein